LFQLFHPIGGVAASGRSCAPAITIPETTITATTIPRFIASPCRNS
jgi:hypothetical protein